MQIILESIDQLGKDSLIQGLLRKLGYHLVVHYSTPILSEKYHNQLTNTNQFPNIPLREYQVESFRMGFKLCENEFNVIFNRSWIGEVVYAPRYRGYSGDYIFELEQEYKNCTQQLHLILLYTDNFDIMKDDGKSLDYSKREEEMEDFIRAFKRSIIPNKIMINVHNGQGGYRPFQDILDEALTFLEKTYYE